MEILKIIVLLLALSNLCGCNVPTTRLCADKECKKIILEGVTKIKYSASKKDYLSFPRNVHVNVYAKYTKNVPEFWEVEVQGRRGYVLPENIHVQKPRVRSDDLIEVYLHKETDIEIKSSEVESTATEPLSDVDVNKQILKGIPETDKPTNASRVQTNGETQISEQEPVKNDSEKSNDKAEDISKSGEVGNENLKSKEQDQKLEDNRISNDNAESLLKSDKPVENSVKPDAMNDNVSAFESVNKSSEKSSEVSLESKSENDLKPNFQKETPFNKFESNLTADSLDINNENSTQTEEKNSELEETKTDDLSNTLQHDKNQNRHLSIENSETTTKNDVKTFSKRITDPLNSKNLDSSQIVDDSSVESDVFKSENNLTEEKIPAIKKFETKSNKDLEPKSENLSEPTEVPPKSESIEGLKNSSEVLSTKESAENLTKIIYEDKSFNSIITEEESNKSLEIVELNEADLTQEDAASSENSLSENDTLKENRYGEKSLDSIEKESSNKIENEGINEISSKDNLTDSRESNEIAEPDANLLEKVIVNEKHAHLERQFKMSEETHSGTYLEKAVPSSNAEIISENHKIYKSEEKNADPLNKSEDEEESDEKQIKDNKEDNLSQEESVETKNLVNDKADESNRSRHLLSDVDYNELLESNEETSLKDDEANITASTITPESAKEAETLHPTTSLPLFQASTILSPVVYDPYKTISNFNKNEENRPDEIQETTPQPIVENSNPLPLQPPSETSQVTETVQQTEAPIANSIINEEHHTLSNTIDDTQIEELSVLNSLLASIKQIWPFGKSTEEQSFEDMPDFMKIPIENSEIPIADEFCERITPNNCPASIKKPSTENCIFPENFFTLIANKILEIIDILAISGIATASTLFFVLGYYCICNSQKESALLSRLNITERSLLASSKEVDILKNDLNGTRHKLSSIEDNSFGSNDMVKALKQELELSADETAKLQEQIITLERELETAAEAGLELNKIVSDLLNSQNGDESIVSSVEELQKQLNEQQNTILDINTILAQKSRENSELQLILAEHNAKYDSEMETLKQDNEELENDRSILQSRLDEIKLEFEQDIKNALEGKNSEIKRLQTEIMNWQPRYDEVYNNWQTSQAKIETLQESLKNVKLDSNSGTNPKELYDLVNMKADLHALERERNLLKERLESENDSKKSLNDQLKNVTSEIEQLKQDFNQTEKDKLEAQTRLEVLSNYFKEKETQLQKELSIKEAMSMQQQGEKTSTIEKVKNMQEEIQSLKSQNDSLRAEIEAQQAAHKAQIGTLEKHAHDSWLAARQSERKYEESRLESTNLRRKLTSLSSNSELGRMQNSTTDGVSSQNNIGLNSAPPPLHMEAPGSPILGGIPPPFLPPPHFISGHPSLPPPPGHFPPMGVPPMFLPPGEVRPPPLGRIMSPPPMPSHHNRYIKNNNSIFDDEYDEDYLYDDERNRRDRRYSDRRHNGRYSPVDRYEDDYTTDVMSRYDTETDFSPPASPRPRSGDGNGYRESDRERDRRSRGGFKGPGSNHSNENNLGARNKSTKGMLSSGSEKSYGSRQSKGGKGLV